MCNMKKDFQKVVRMYRDTLPDVTNWRNEPCRPEFPKAMMTEQQIRKGTATVNLGYAKEERARELFNGLTAFAPFVVWCESYGATVTGLELNPDGRYQVRIRV